MSMLLAKPLSAHGEIDKSSSRTDDVSSGRVNYGDWFAALSRDVQASAGGVVTLHPRGSLALTQTWGATDLLLRGYASAYWREDKLTFAAVKTGQPTRLSDLGGGAIAETLGQLLGVKYAIAVPLSSPVFPGFNGAVHLYRTGAAGDFSDAEISLVKRHVEQLENQLVAARHGEPKASRANASPGLAIFDVNGHVVLGQGYVDSLDAKVRAAVVEHVNAIAKDNKAETDDGRRVSFADSNGVLVPLRVVKWATIPALGDGAFIAVARNPSRADWKSIAAADFAADTEVARLVPALRFMDGHFGSGPTLNDISRSVHLSPFHFHRRFSELMGVTPKHYLLDCQIDESKRLLAGRQTELAEIAKVCGFAHQSHFTSRFKQATGLTPTKWRRLASEPLV